MNRTFAATLPGLLLVLSTPLLPAGCQSPADKGPDRDTAPAVSTSAKPLYEMTPAEIDRTLNFMPRMYPDVSERVIALARRNIGQPYEIYLLGEFPFEFHDPDPLFNLRQSDCVTFCEHIYAMALADDWWEFLGNLQRLRYVDGKVGMLTRNHWTVVDWDRNNAYLFEDLTPTLNNGRAHVTLTQTVDRAAFFKKFGIGQDIEPQPVRDTYIPTENVPAVLDELRNGDFVNIIRGSATSQYAGHTGLIAIADDGAVNFLHSARPAVREELLMDYLESDRRCVGVKFLRLRPNADRLMAEARARAEEATDISESSLHRAFEAYRTALPTAIAPPPMSWAQATALQTLRLPADAPVDARLQRHLEAIDANIRQSVGIEADQRAVGLLRVNDQKVAWLNPDQMFYAASVPKLVILASYFAYEVDDPDALSAAEADELARMIKQSDNALATKYAEIVGLDAIQEFVTARQYRFYDEDTGGGLWMGKYYGRSDKRVGDPLHDHSHGATARQLLRFYLLLEQGRLVSMPASVKMKEIMHAPQLDHIDHKFVAGLDLNAVSVLRKSGTWEQWHLDTARVRHGDDVYVLVGLTRHADGATYLKELATQVDALVASMD